LGHVPAGPNVRACLIYLGGTAYNERIEWAMATVIGYEGLDLRGVTPTRWRGMGLVERVRRRSDGLTTFDWVAVVAAFQKMVTQTPS
jgi:hypothetical protein